MGGELQTEANRLSDCVANAAACWVRRPVSHFDTASEASCNRRAVAQHLTMLRHFVQMRLQAPSEARQAVEPLALPLLERRQEAGESIVAHVTVPCVVKSAGDGRCLGASLPTSLGLRIRQLWAGMLHMSPGSPHATETGSHAGPCVLAGDALPFWLLMTLLTSPDGERQRGLRVLYDAATGEFMVRSTACCVTAAL